MTEKPRIISPNTWMTPPDILDLVEKIGNGGTPGVGIALDPCGDRNAPATQRAREAFILPTDGLKQDWWRAAQRHPGAVIFVNPPYGAGLIEPWVVKAMAEFRANPGNPIVMLLPANRTEQRWFQTLLRYRPHGSDSGIFFHFLQKRVRFLESDTGKPAKGTSSNFASVLVTMADVAAGTRLVAAVAHPAVPKPYIPLPLLSPFV